MDEVGTGDIVVVEVVVVVVVVVVHIPRSSPSEPPWADIVPSPDSVFTCGS